MCTKLLTKAICMKPVRSGLLLLCLLLLATRPLLAQRGHAYWDANGDSLRQVLARQRADTARLRTLEHLSDCLAGKTDAQRYHDLEQIVALAHKLHRPEYRAYRMWLNGSRLFDAEPPNDKPDRATNTLAQDSMQAAISQFDMLGHQQPRFLRVLLNAFGDVIRTCCASWV